MVIDYSTIEELLAYLRSTTTEIDTFGITKEVLEENNERSAAVKYLLHTAVEACSNIAEVIVFGLDLGNPTTTKEVFPLLVRHKIIGHTLSDKLQKAVGMRNVLVHMYLKVDLGIVYNAATIGLDDLRDFAKAINEFLEKQES